LSGNMFSSGSAITFNVGIGAEEAGVTFFLVRWLHAHNSAASSAAAIAVRVVGIAVNFINKKIGDGEGNERLRILFIAAALKKSYKKKYIM
jgi:hypothetical protein